jgi:hypothetical protein
MKRQYRYYETATFRYNVELYHDGKLVKTYEVWFGDELSDRIDTLEELGYTYGFTEKEVEEARCHYERLLKNKIG